MLKTTIDGCVETTFAVGAEDRVLIQGSTPKETSHFGLSIVEYDTCIQDYVWWAQPADPLDPIAGGWDIPPGAFTISPSGKTATLNWTFRATTYEAGVRLG